MNNEARIKLIFYLPTLLLMDMLGGTTAKPTRGGQARRAFSGATSRAAGLKIKSQ
jgi:hypothetical protein